MSRRVIALTVLSLAAVVVIAACQDYNFNPVGACVIQPGSHSATLNDLTTADILFVVDDSGSMDDMQNALKTAFGTFITELNAASQKRVEKGLDPFDFHIAVTSSSIFENNVQFVNPRTRCTGSAGQTQCCNIGTCSDVTSCTPGADCGTGGKCSFELKQAPYPPSFAFKCCTVNSCTPRSCVPGDFCPNITTQYAGTGTPYPAGNFISAGSNPKVLHFTKDLYQPTRNDAAILALTNQFEANIKVGKDGSSQEQHLEAGRLAMQKALAGQYGSEFPHKGAKLVVVWVGDEDDCSIPNDPAKAITLTVTSPGIEECVADKNLNSTNNPNGLIPQRAIPIATYRDFFEGLVAPPGEAPSGARPYRAFSAAFIGGVVSCLDSNRKIVSYAALDRFLEPVCPASSTASFHYTQNVIACSGGIAAIPPASLPASPPGAEISAAGVRLNALASSFKADGIEVVEGSACDDFGPILAGIANLVTAPSKLPLPSLPASGEITVVRIVDASGNQRKVCTQQTSATSTPATAGGWWFMACGDSNVPPAVSTIPTTCIYLNHDNATRDCEANPGETYSVEYLGLVPQPNGCTTATDCAQALTGNATNANLYTCYKPSDSPKGTCLCNTKN